MRPQDIAVLIKMIADNDNSMKFKDLSFCLHLSGSEISESLNRSHIAGLLTEEKNKVNRKDLLDFVNYGLRYVFPAILGPSTLGMPTAHSHDFMKGKIKSNENCVWPMLNGRTRGAAIEPLYRGLVKSLSDPRFYKMMALIDVVRIGRPKESEIAKAELKPMIIPE